MTGERLSVSVGGRRVTYQASGDPAHPAVVLLHGIGGNASQWRTQLDALADRFHVIAWDAPGYGGSDDPEPDWLMADYARALAGFLDALGIVRAHIVGQSWGGILAQEFYREHADRYVSLTLSDTYAGGAQAPEEREASLQARLRALDTMTPAEMAVARAPAVLGPDPAPAVRAEVETMLAEIRPSGYRVAAIALARAETRDVLPTVAVPTFIVTGEHDQIVPPSAGEWLSTQIPGARLVTIAGAGHLAGQERPDEYTAALRQFLTETIAQ